MRATAKFTKPGDIEVTITMTASLEKWQELRDDLKEAPFYGLARDLRGAVDDMTIKLMGCVNYEPPAPEQERADG